LDLNSFQQEIVELTGMVIRYRGKPEIILKSKGQLKFISTARKRIKKLQPSYTK